MTKKEIESGLYEKKEKLSSSPLPENVVFFIMWAMFFSFFSFTWREY